MSKLVEILGRGISTNVSNLIWHWLAKVSPKRLSGFAADEMEGVLSAWAQMNLITAEERLRFYLFENESCPLGRLAAAAICLHTDRLGEAIEQLQSVYMREPANTMALYTLGYCHERLGQEAEAVEFYQDCVKFKHYLQLPHERLAAIYLKRGQVERSIEHYEHITRESPDDVASLAMLGHLYLSCERYVPAIETFSRAIVIHPDNFESREDQTPAGGEDVLEAIGGFSGSYEPEPEDAEQCVRRADALVETGDHAEAIAYYRRAVRLRPDFLEASIKLGTALLAMGRQSLAAQAFSSAAETNDQIVDVYIGLATAQELAGRVNDAQATLSLAAAIHQNSTILFAETARLQFRELASLAVGDSKEDALIMDRVLQAHQREASARREDACLQYRLGLLLMGTGRLNAARSAFIEALGGNQLYHRARTKLAVCLFEMGDTQRAMDTLIDGRVPDREMIQLHYKTAILYCDKANFADAVEGLQDWMKDNLVAVGANASIAVVLENMGLMDRAACLFRDLAITASQAVCHE